MLQPNIFALVVFIRNLLCIDAVNDPNESETIRSEYMIKKKELIKLFKTYNGNFIDDIVENAFELWGPLIPISEFVNFIIYDATRLNEGKYTQGYYHIYMDFIHVLFDIKCLNFNDLDNDQLGLPNYKRTEKLDKTLYKKIYPKRKEFIFAWWIMHIVRKFYSKYIKVTVDFQVRIEGKIFDIFIRELDIVIEYQEAKANHDNTETDKDKKAIIRGQGMVCEYFQESMYNKNPDKYLHDFWKNQLEKRIIQGLIKQRKNNNFLDAYVYELFIKKIQSMKEKLKKQNNEYVKIRIKQLDDVMHGNVDQIKKIFMWKDMIKESRVKNDKKLSYIISPNDIALLLRINDNKRKDFIKKEMHKLAITYDDQHNTDWNGLITFMLMVDADYLDIDNVLKRAIIDYLTSIQDIYDYLMDELDGYNISLINNLIDNSKRRKDYIKKTTQAKYEKTIITLTNKNNEQAVIIQDYMTQSKKTLQIVKKVCSIIAETCNIHEDVTSCCNEIINSTPIKWQEKNPRKYKQLTNNKKNLQNLQSKLDNNQKEIEQYKTSFIQPKQSYTIIEEFEIGKPIVNEIPEIIYTGKFNDEIDVNKLKSFFKRNTIPMKVCKMLIDALSPYANNPDYVSKISLIEFEDESTIKESNKSNSDDTDKLTDETNTDESDETKSEKSIDSDESDSDLLDIGDD